MTAPVAPPGRWVLRLVGLTLKHWREDNCPLIAAGLAYYTIISLVPLFLIALALGGMLLGPIASVNQLAPALEDYSGPRSRAPSKKWCSTPRSGNGVARPWPAWRFFSGWRRSCSTTCSAP
ncbi:MAG: YihY/virulence factor BrkB family protein [Elusimicrobia bacterium]|nr:YihY/virulence factor BrkB family protein [Elusimicrobiota bacterium]